MSNRLANLLDTRNWVYWLDETQPHKHARNFFRVCLVFENESGFYPTGGNDEEPWYWDKKTCKRSNESRGFSEEEAFKIVASSMFAEGHRNV